MSSGSGIEMVLHRRRYRIVSLCTFEQTVCQDWSGRILLRLADLSLWNLTTGNLLDQVASVKATPGGGSVSIITAALGLALVHKGISISLKRSASEIVRHQSLVNLSVNLSSSMKTLSLFADADASAFESYSVARALPRTTEIEIADRTKTMQDSLLRATEVPLESAREMTRGLEFAEAALDVADRHVMSDVVAGTLLLHTSIKSVLLNVDANLGNIQDAAQREVLKNRKAEIERASEICFERIDGRLRAALVTF
jgi:methenyltetrahydrofolate cyclohydrolase